MKKKISIGYVGLGRRGFAMLKDCFALMNDVEISVICDRYEPYIEKTIDLYKEYEVMDQLRL